MGKHRTIIVFIIILFALNIYQFTKYYVEHEYHTCKCEQKICKGAFLNGSLKQYAANNATDRTRTISLTEPNSSHSTAHSTPSPTRIQQVTGNPSSTDRKQTPDHVTDSGVAEVLHWNASARLRQVYDYTCPQQLSFTTVSQLHICGHIRHTDWRLVLFTTMYYSEQQMKYYYNTLRVTATLQNDFNMQAVVYIENPKSFIDNNAVEFIQFACDLDFVVLLVPHCNEDNFPVFKSMFNVSMELWSADWYGYSNGDMLYDDSLMSTVEFAHAHTDTYPITLLAGRRYNTKIGDSYNISTYKDVKPIFHTALLDNGKAIDYFIVRNQSFPWHQVPDFVIGRPYFDKWTIWFSQHMKLAIVDTTATVRAVHQIRDAEYADNTYLRRRVNDSMDYNRRLGEQLAMIFEGKREIVGRGRTHYPVPADDEQLRKAINELHFAYPASSRREQKIQRAIIPFVPDSMEHVFVLAKRTCIATKTRSKYVVSDYKKHCHNFARQNIDMDIANFLAF